MSSIRLSVTGDARVYDLGPAAWHQQGATENPVVLDLQDPVLNANLIALITRPAGRWYRVDSAGYLKTAYRWSFLRDPEGEQARVRQAVTAVLEGLEKAVHYDTHRFVLEKIFAPDSPLVRMHPCVFDRKEIQQKNTLEEVIAPHWIAAREAFRVSLKGNNLETAETAFRTFCVAEYEFARRLGLDLVSSGGGSGGARIAQGLRGQSVLVVKPEDEGPYGKHNPRLWGRIKQWITLPRRSSIGNSEPVSEYAAWKIDRACDIRVVPTTGIHKITSRQFVGPNKDKQCSVQVFIGGSVEAGKYLGIGSYLRWLPRGLLTWLFSENPQASRDQKSHDFLGKLPAASMERLGAISQLTGDSDGHFSNWMLCEQATTETLAERIVSGIRNKTGVSEGDINTLVNSFFSTDHFQDFGRALLAKDEITDSSGNKKILRLVKHDGGYGMPNKHPITALEAPFHFLFATLPHFQQPWSPRSQAFVQQPQEERFWGALEEIAQENLFSVFPQIEEDKIRKASQAWCMEIRQGALLPKQQKRLEARHVLATLIREALPEEKNAPGSPYVERELERIEGILSTALQRWHLLKEHVGRQRPMQETFRVRTRGAFVQWLRTRKSQSAN